MKKLTPPPMGSDDIWVWKRWGNEVYIYLNNLHTILSKLPVTAQTADETYSANEQTMMEDLKTSISTIKNNFT